MPDETRLAFFINRLEGVKLAEREMMFRKGFYFDGDSGGAGSTPPAEAPKEPPAPPKEPEPKTIPYERFKEINDKANDLEKQMQKFTDAQKKASEDALKEQNKWKELYESKEKEAAEKAQENLKLRVAQEKGIPADLTDRLVGATKEELEADADKLLAFMKPGSPGIPPKGKTGTAALLDIKNMSPKEIRENASELMRQSGTN